MSTPTVPTPAPADPPTPRVALDLEREEARNLLYHALGSAQERGDGPTIALAERLLAQVEGSPRVGHYPITDPDYIDGALVSWSVGPRCTCLAPWSHPHGIDA